MIQKAIDILKVRWPEVMLVVVLQTALMLFLDDFMSTFGMMTPEQNERLPVWPNFFLGVGLVAYMVIVLRLYLGFLKSAATDGQTSQEPRQLLRVGGPYFFRMLIFQLFLEAGVSVLAFPIVAVLGGSIWHAQDVSAIPDWFIQLASLFGMMVLMKPFFLIPARILVYEDTVFRALTAIWKYQLGRIDHFMKWALSGFGLIAVIILIGSLAAARTPVYYVLSGLHYLMFSLVFLGLTLTTVLWLQEQLETQRAYSMEGPVQ